MEAVTGIHLDLDDALSLWSEERQIDFVSTLSPSDIQPSSSLDQPRSNGV